MKHIIDLSKEPKIPSSLKIHTHIKGDENFEYSPNKVELFLSEEQKNGRHRGYELQKEIVNPFNACLLDYLLEHQELIPEEWKGNGVYFWGTIYSDSDGSLYVRYLYWLGDEWFEVYGWLGPGWCSNFPAAVLASKSVTTDNDLPKELIINGIKYIKNN